MDEVGNVDEAKGSVETASLHNLRLITVGDATPVPFRNEVDEFDSVAINKVTVHLDDLVDEVLDGEDLDVT